MVFQYYILYLSRNLYLIMMVIFSDLGKVASNSPSTYINTPFTSSKLVKL